MKYKIAICDDSGADRQFVLNVVRAWASSAGHTVHIDDFRPFSPICPLSNHRFTV